MTTAQITPTLLFRRESMSESLTDENKRLLEAHWAEVALDKDWPLDPDYAAYEALERDGYLRVYVIREAGQAVGYAVFIVMRDSKCQTVLAATAELLYLIPSLRRLGLAGRFVQWCDEQLAHEGVTVVRHGVQTAKDFGLMLESLRYRQEQIVYSRRLDLMGKGA